jgi:hypothetical protein
MAAALLERYVVDLPWAAPLDKFLAALVASPLLTSAVGRLVVLQVMPVVLTDHAFIQEGLFPLLQLSVLVLPPKLPRLLPFHQQRRAAVSFRGKVLDPRGSFMLISFQFSWGLDALTFERYKQIHQHSFRGKYDCSSNCIRDR